MTLKLVIKYRTTTQNVRKGLIYQMEGVLDPFESRLGVRETNNDKFRGRKTPEYGLMTVHMTLITVGCDPETGDKITYYHSKCA